MLELKWKRILPCCAVLLASSWVHAAEPPTISVSLAYDDLGRYSARVTGSDPEGGPTTLEYTSIYVHYYRRTRGYYGDYDEADWSGGPFDPAISATDIGFLQPDAAGVIQGQYYFSDSSEVYSPYGGTVRFEAGYDQNYVNARVRDAEGLVSQTVGILFSPLGWPQFFTGALYLPPVALDLDGDGVETVPFRSSKIAFPASKSAPPSTTGWIGADDAMLVLDRNNDGVVNDGGEISFINDVPNAKSDLGGLRAYDSNGNGLLDTQDERYSEFLVWRDANQDGRSQPNELRPLLAYDIRSIELTPTPTAAAPTDVIDNLITGIAEFTRGDGTKGTVGDVSLAYLGDIAASPIPASVAQRVLHKY